MIWLADVAQSRDNNFNLIRAVAAVAVLVSHAYPIALGPGTPEPLKALTGFTLGGIAVQAFFVISGFLIAQSFMRARSRTQFMMARFLRLWPALIVSIVAVALILGPIVTKMTTEAYFSTTSTWTFIARNIILIEPQYYLPGVFEDLPYTAVEGSISTLFYEVLCYLGVFVLGVFGALGRPKLMVAVFLVFLTAYLGVRAFNVSLHPKIINIITLALPFGVGTAFYIWRTSLPLTMLGVVGLACTSWLARDSLLYEPIFVLAVGYFVFWMAYVPKNRILHSYNQLGDYSYGIYIYAFPLQGLVIWIWGPMSPLENIALSLPLVLLPSVLSWHLIEKPALDARGRLTTWVSSKIPSKESAV